ncbi:DUF1302 domain-containing protein [Azoarcus sp. KH32C]|uniref:DUF1302 domain-containing protein n=1 Tax=Azoarcus sp. KH32C TaxID=748247 RepID=UPI0002386943|nr:DUF1302 domain-containing protein [Azoarcus sp. KH32C]BAL24278.1 hypothetical protein AZKH_1965 [Azoarcus sp. KH32C]
MVRKNIPAGLGMRVCATTAAVLSALATMSVAHAFEIDTGNPDLGIRWDNTVRYNYAHRVESQNSTILASPNADDGDRNFDKGTVSSRVDLLTEFDFVYRKAAGFRVSAAGWYDDAYGQLDNDNVASSNHLSNGLPATGLSDVTKRFHKGPSGEILDAFVFGSVDLGDMSLSAKAGKHTVYWGEALLSPFHGVNYGQAPLDLRKLLSVPGTEAKELLLPRNAVSAQLVATPELSLNLQYFLDWKPFRIPEAGSFLGGFDMLVDGGESIIAAPGRRLERGSSVEPKKQGDWGVSSRWSPQWLDGTVGLYYRRTADIQPQIHIQPAVASLGAATCGALGFTPLAATTCYINPSAATPAQLRKGIIGQYRLVYPGDVDVFGVSLAKNVGGVSVGAEINYRQNMPLASDVVTVFAPGRGSAVLAAATPGAIVGLPGSGNTGGAVGDTWHGVFNLLGTMSRTPLFDSASWVTELQWNRWERVTQGEAVFKGRSSYTGIDKVSKDFFGLSVNFTPTWFQVLPGVDLSAPIAYSVGLSGNSAVSSGGNEGAGSYSIGLAADVYQKYRIDLKYVDFFGDYKSNAAGAIASNRGLNALLSDRGFVSLTFKTTF